MKLDEGLIDQKLSLDVTPLIDVVFLLVLFFAVGTSFISTEDLEDLQSTLVSLSVDKHQLSGRLHSQDEVLAELDEALSGLQGDYDEMVERKTAELKQLASEVARAEGEQAKAEWMIEALRSEQVSLEQMLGAARGEAGSLQAQLEQAFRDYQALDVELGRVRDERARQAETERLLITLYAERASEAEKLESALDASVRERAELAGTVTALEREALDREEIRRRLAALLASREEAVGEQSVELALLREQVARMRKQADRYRALAELDEEQVRRLAEARASLTQALSAYAGDERLRIKPERERITLQLSDQVLFDSGSAEIKAEGLSVLRSVGAVLKERLGALSVQIGGHTDNVPIRGVSVESSARAGRDATLDSNWGLSAARAVRVVRFLEDEVGIGADRLSAVGYGEHRPIAGNDDAQGRARNRRIEIVLLPRR